MGFIQGTLVVTEDGQITIDRLHEMSTSGIDLPLVSAYRDDGTIESVPVEHVVEHERTIYLTNVTDEQGQTVGGDESQQYVVYSGEDRDSERETEALLPKDDQALLGGGRIVKTQKVHMHGSGVRTYSLVTGGVGGYIVICTGFEHGIPVVACD